MFHVAMIRTKGMLYVYLLLRYYHRRFGPGDRHGYAQLTRFISAKVGALFEEATEPTDDRHETLDEQAANRPTRLSRP